VILAILGNVDKHNKMKLLFLIIFILFQLECFAQTDGNRDNFSKVIMHVTGDLNKDNRADSVIVMQDTLDEHAPYRLQLFSRNPMGSQH